MEKDPEITGQEGSHYTAPFWEYDTRIARRWNVDPVDKPWESSYAAFANNPIVMVDPDGDFAIVIPAIAALVEAAFIVITAKITADVVAEKIKEYHWVNSDGKKYECRTEQPLNNIQFRKPNNPKGSATLIGVLIYGGLQLLNDQKVMNENAEELGKLTSGNFKDDSELLFNRKTIEVISNSPEETMQLFLGYVASHATDMTEEEAMKINNIFDVMIDYAKDGNYLSPQQMAGMLNPDETEANFIARWMVLWEENNSAKERESVDNENTDDTVSD